MFAFRRYASMVVLVLGSVGVAAPASATATPPRVVSIAQARALPLGTTVTVYATATTPSGWLESSSFDKGFGLQDHSAGIYVSVAVDLAIAPRDKVLVTGQLRDSFGLLQLAADPSQVHVRGKGSRIHPRRTATGAVNEATEGSLVRVAGAVTQAPVSDLPYGYIFHLDDGSGDLTIFVSTQPNIDLSGVTIGKTVAVTGFSGQFDTHYEVNPRFQSDITVSSRGAGD
ncbi:hypothetical protein Rhe02_21020 [Rhizocola hellebori]|uniref:Nucleotide-binding protein n=1 Tax=Rhizocola hellebori TaxID=1392758 RepID=A0A8J3Q565_9ACTN|nr:hypothetical protein [Rhizocola hellebori]GIH04035.1 hypothetical protein Rhe02_21020 [Rhizocola hellebori]